MSSKRKPSQAQAFDFRGAPPPEMAVLSVPVALARLQAHLATCPGTYLECHAKGPKAQAMRAAWVRVKEAHEFRLKLAELYPEVVEKRAKNPQNTQQLPVSHFLGKLERAIKQIGATPGPSPEHSKLREEARRYLRETIYAAKRDGYEGPIPSLPEPAKHPIKITDGSTAYSRWASKPENLEKKRKAMAEAYAKRRKEEE